VAFIGFNWFAVLLMTVCGNASSWWLQRMSAELREQRFRFALNGLVLGGVAVASLAMFLAGVPFNLVVAPSALALVFATIRLGWVMVRVGRRDPWRGLDWLGVTMIIHGIWICTYPAVVATSWHAVGHLVEAILEIGVGGGMVTYIMIRTMGQLAELDRLKHEFLNAASHELRSPLTSVLGYAEFLQDELGGPLTPAQADYVDQIRKSGLRLRRIVDEMLDLARVQAGAFELAPAPVELGGIVREEVLALVPQARERELVLEVVVPERPFPAVVDGARVGQVVQNLVINAIKFTPPGGRVEVSLVAEATGYRVEVADSGIGVAPEHQERLFEKFFQVDTGTRRAHGGAGLGLAIAKALVDAHGGRIGVKSSPGRGSTFWFALPGARPAPSALPAPARETAAGSPRSGGAG
jgi:signal transduction histidine kinase